jgi:hypothetical protein
MRKISHNPPTLSGTHKGNLFLNTVNKPVISVMCLCLYLSSTRNLKFSVLRWSIDKQTNHFSIFRTLNPCSNIQDLATTDPPLALSRSLLEEAYKCCCWSWHGEWTCSIYHVHYVLKHITTLHWDSWLKNNMSACVVDSENNRCCLIMSVTPNSADAPSRYVDVNLWNLHYYGKYNLLEHCMGTWWIYCDSSLASLRKFRLHPVATDHHSNTSWHIRGLLKL